MARNKYPEETIALIVDESLKLFIEKGYDNTSIQDIINNLGGLSKGAIYHHFKSKDEIFEAVCQKIGTANEAYYGSILDDSSKTGCEQLRLLLQGVYSNPTSDAMYALIERIVREPKFLSNQIFEIYEDVAPNYILPIINRGIEDGSIQTDYPKELAEVMITLLNIWMNPLIAKCTADDLQRKLAFFSQLLNGIGIDVFDDEIQVQTLRYLEKTIKPTH